MNASRFGKQKFPESFRKKSAPPVSFFQGLDSQAVVNLHAQEPVLPQFPEYGICILESRHTNEFTMPASRFDFSEVMLVLEGKGWIVQGNTRHPLSRQNLMSIPAGSCYRLEDHPGTPLAVLCLCLRPLQEQKMLWSPVLPERFAVHRNAVLSREISNHLRAILLEQSCPQAGIAAAVTAHSLLLLTKLKRKISNHSTFASLPRDGEILSRVQEYIQQLSYRFHESETLESIAAHLRISPKSLTSHFRTLTGQSRQQYIQNLRIEHACRLLHDTTESITSISFACGFEDISTFFRAFRLIKKMSPSQWRNP